MKMIKRRFKKNFTMINYQKTANFKKRMNLNARAIIKLQSWTTNIKATLQGVGEKTTEVITEEVG